MKQQCRPNRNITTGDQGSSEIRSINDIKARMTDWSDNFIKKVYYEPRSPLWFQAAKETLNERRVPRDGPVVQAPPPQKTWKYKKNGNKKRKPPKEVRQANSTNWKLDREMEQRIRDEK